MQSQPLENAGSAAGLAAQGRFLPAGEVSASRIYGSGVSGSEVADSHFRTQPSNLQTARLIALPDNRRLSYIEYGLPTGYPLFYFHNHASSALEARSFHIAARKSGFRIIAVDRPGIGLSDPCKKTTHLSFAADLVELSDVMQIPRFGILTWAGGSPFAFAAASKYANRVKLLIALAPLPLQTPAHEPVNTPKLFALFLLRYFIGIRHLLSTGDTRRYLQRLSEELCFADRKILQNPRIQQLLEGSISAAKRQGGLQVFNDSVLSITAWRFSLETLNMPVHLWHGSADNVIPLHHTHSLAEKLSDCVVRKVANRGHYFFMQDADEIFAAARNQLGLNNPSAANSPFMDDRVGSAKRRLVI